MNRLGFLTINFKHRSLLMATVPIICLTNWFNKRQINRFWPTLPSRQLSPLRSAQLVNNEKVFNKEFFESFVAIRSHFEKTETNEFDGCHRLLCSGFIVKNTGLVLTAQNLISHYTLVSVKFNDGREVLGRVVVRYSYQGMSAIQLIGDGEWRPVGFHKTGVHKMGTRVFAVTNESFGCNNTLSSGHICGQVLEGFVVTDMLALDEIKYVPISAPVRDREMGAAVVDEEGRVLGITVLSTNTHLSCYVTNDHIEEFLEENEEILTDGEPNGEPKKSLGLITQWIDANNIQTFKDLAKREGKPFPDVDQGLLVLGFEMGMTKDSKINRFDVIIDIDGQELYEKQDVLKAMIFDFKPPLGKKESQEPSLEVIKSDNSVVKVRYNFDTNNFHQTFN